MKIRLGQINLLLGIIGAIFLCFFILREPIFIGYLAVMCLPGILLSYLFSRHELTFLERISLSLPVSNVILILFKIFTILGIPFSSGSILYFVVLLPIAISLINYRFFVDRFKELGSKKIELGSAGFTLFIVAVAFFLCFIVWSSLLQDSQLALTDQVVQFSWIETYRNMVLQHGRYPYWTSAYSGGFALSLFESSLYYERIATNLFLFPGHNTTFHINYYNFLNFVLLLIGIYCLARRLGWGKTSAIFSMILFISCPLIASKCGYSGDMKEMTSFAILPIMLVVFLLMLEKKEKGYYVLLGVLAASYYFTNLVPLIPSLMMMFFFFLFYKLAKKEFLEKGEIIKIGILCLTVVCLIGFNLVPLFFSLKYGTPGTWTINYDFKTFVKDMLVPMFSEPLTKPESYSHNMGLFFSVSAVLGMVLSLVKPKKKEVLLLLAFWLTLFCYVIPFLNLPLNHVEGHRFVLLILMVFSLFAARLFDLPEIVLNEIMPFLAKRSKDLKELVKNNASQIAFYAKIGCLLVFIIILAIYLPITRIQTTEWVKEGAQNGLFEQVYQYLDTVGPGRVINYGVFAYTTEPLIPVESNSLWMISHTTAGGARTIPQYELKDGSESGLNIDYSLTYIINRMRTTFTRYIIVVKDPNRMGDVTHSVLAGYFLTYLNTTPLYDSTPLSIFMIPDTYYIQSVVPIKTELSKKEIYSDFYGWKAFGFGYSSKATDYEMIINSTKDLKKIPTPVPYKYKINYEGDMEITGDFRGEWIIVKDHYFPTWHAYMNGKEIRIEESNLGTLLLKTEEGDRIYLTHKPYWYEPILAILTIIFILGAIAFFIMSDKYGVGEE